MTTAEHMQKLDAAVREEGKPVTYKWVARELDVSVNHAKRLLFALANKGGCEAVHVVAGWSGAGAERKHVVRLVSGGADAIEAAKAALDEVTTEHVHSVRASGATPRPISPSPRTRRRPARRTPCSTPPQTHRTPPRQQTQRRGVRAGEARARCRAPRLRQDQARRQGETRRRAQAPAAAPRPPPSSPRRRSPRRLSRGSNPFLSPPAPQRPNRTPRDGVVQTRRERRDDVYGGDTAKAPPKKTATTAPAPAPAPADDASDDEEEEEEMEIPDRRGGARRVGRSRLR